MAFELAKAYPGNVGQVLATTTFCCGSELSSVFRRKVTDNKNLKQSTEYNLHHMRQALKNKVKILLTKCCLGFAQQ